MAYSITGTSQFLSVPYAQHANTADSLTYPVVESDPVFDTSVAAGITLADTANWNNKLGSFIESDPLFDTSVAAGITKVDTVNWNNKLDSYTETQNLADVLDKSNDGNALQIKNIADPNAAQDAVTKSFLDEPNEGATNESGFTALPAGYRSKNSNFLPLGEYTTFWTSSLLYSYYPLYRRVRAYTPNISRNADYNQGGFSVRCIKD